MMNVILHILDKPSYGRMYTKANLSWSPSWAKFCQLIASLSVVKAQTWVSVVRLYVLKKDINTGKIYFSSLEFDFFRVQLMFAFRIRPLVF